MGGFCRIPAAWLKRRRRREEGSDKLYRELDALCVDGIMTAYPSRYERYLTRENVIGPGRRAGTDPCVA